MFGERTAFCPAIRYVICSVQLLILIDEWLLYVAIQWLAVFPQLVCRVTHPNDQVWKILQEIIGKVLSEYPKQAMWSMVGGCQSNDQHRKKRSRDVIQKVKSKANKAPDALQTAAIINQAINLSVQLLRLCDHPVQSKVTTLSMAQTFPELVRLDCSQLLLPIQSSLVVGLPPNNLSSSDHQPFPDGLPTIAGFHDYIEIMNSLQKPRKVIMKSSNGEMFNFLCKPKDDLRKDARLMDFDSMINKLLQSSPESRRRKLCEQESVLSASHLLLSRNVLQIFGHTLWLRSMRSVV